MTLQGTWGLGEGRDDEVVLAAVRAKCDKCEHELFYIVMIPEFAGDIPLCMCQRCGNIGAVNPPADDA